MKKMGHGNPELEVPSLPRFFQVKLGGIPWLRSQYWMIKNKFKIFPFRWAKNWSYLTEKIKIRHFLLTIQFARFPRMQNAAVLKKVMK